jgi:hypothetical protein
MFFSEKKRKRFRFLVPFYEKLLLHLILLTTIQYEYFENTSFG